MPLTPAELRARLTGPIVAMTTPFNKDLSVDFAGLRHLTDYYAESGIKTVIVAGSTGEFASMSDDERKQRTHIRIVPGVSWRHACVARRQSRSCRDHPVGSARKP